MHQNVLLTENRLNFCLSVDYAETNPCQIKPSPTLRNKNIILDRIDHEAGTVF